MSIPLVTARKLTDFVQSWCGISTVIFVKTLMCLFLSKNCFVERRTSDMVNDSNFDTLRIMISHFRIFTCVCIIAKNAF